MKYQTHELAKMAGVSTRTLHYYDEINLLEPAEVDDRGYRTYGEKELQKLQQILFFRELEFPLDEIKKILADPNFNQEAALQEHRKMIEIKRKRLTKLLTTIDNTLRCWIPAKAEGKIMKDEELFEGFDEQKTKEYHEEAKQRWGDTDAYEQSAKRTNGWAKEDFSKVKEEWEAVFKAYAEVVEHAPESFEVQAVVQRHWDQISKFYDPTPEILLGLADMYVADPRFAKNYPKHHPDLPEFVREAIKIYCKNK